MILLSVVGLFCGNVYGRSWWDTDGTDLGGIWTDFLYSIRRENSWILSTNRAIEIWFL